MSKHKHQRHYQPATTLSEQLLALLQTRAMTRAAEFGHSIGLWASAKKKWGKAAKKAYCTRCGDMALLLPYGPSDVTPAARQPTLRGDALFLLCKHALPSQQTPLPLPPSSVMTKVDV